MSPNLLVDQQATRLNYQDRLKLVIWTILQLLQKFLHYQNQHTHTNMKKRRKSKFHTRQAAMENRAMPCMGQTLAQQIRVQTIT